MPLHGLVTFLSDYGLEDEFVGVCHGVMRTIAPDLTIVDVHHNILRQDIRHGAVVLEQAIRYMPHGVHLAVVDPGVGSNRRAVAVVTSDDEAFVGPDNGLLMPALRTRGGARAAWEITNPEWMLEPVSRTFQGRDVFAPAAARLASGLDPHELGPEVDPVSLVELEVPTAWVHDDHLHAEVLQIDRFGNLQLNFGRALLEEVGLSAPVIEVRLEGHRLLVPLGRTFADVSAGEYVLIEDSYDYLSLAVNKGDAARRLRARSGSTAIVGPARR